MSVRHSFILALALAAPALAQQQQRPAPQLPPLGHPSGVFGAGVTDREPVRLADVAARLPEFAGRSVRIDASITDVCTRKGCWMVVRDGDLEVRVRFKDYSFFVPRDAHGRRVLIQGEVSEVEIPEEAARHYAEESGHPERAAEIHGPQRSLAILATGVEVLGADGQPLASEGAPEAKAALAAKLAQATKVQAGAAPADAAAAFRALRAVPGARTEELPYMTEHDGWFVFSADGDAPFSRGWAIKRATGEVFRF